MVKTAAFLPILALILAGPAVAQNTGTGPSATSNVTGTRLDLQARGVVRVVPNLAVINAGVVTQAANANSAMRSNAARMERVFAALKAAGIADEDIRTQSVSLSPQYRYVENAAPVITGYQASNSISVQFKDIKNSGAVLDTLVQQGANEINGPNFVVEDRTAAEDKARGEALRTLRTRAALYAAATGLKVRRIISLSESMEMPSPPMPYLMARAAAADMGQPKTSIAPGEQEVAITVSAVFELQ